MQDTDWKTFGIGMAAGIALSVSVYFAWSLLRPAPRDTANVAATASVPLPLEENALVAANAERPQNSLGSPLQLGPGLEPAPAPAAELAPTPPPVRIPPVVRPDPRPVVEDEGPPEEDPPLDEDLDKPEG
jgi:hypothetical protein